MKQRTRCPVCKFHKTYSGPVCPSCKKTGYESDISGRIKRSHAYLPQDVETKLVQAHVSVATLVPLKTIMKEHSLTWNDVVEASLLMFIDGMK